MGVDVRATGADVWFLLSVGFTCARGGDILSSVCLCVCRCCLLQADSERQQQAWISAVQNSIASAFQERREDPHSPVTTHAPLLPSLAFCASSHSCIRVRQRQRCSSVSASSLGGCGAGGVDQENEGRKALDEIQAIPGNRQCCDCGEPGPDWASINLGITLCIVCSGIHRYT